jgi:hypothetical protein
LKSDFLKLVDDKIEFLTGPLIILFNLELHLFKDLLLIGVLQHFLNEIDAEQPLAVEMLGNAFLGLADEGLRAAQGLADGRFWTVVGLAEGGRFDLHFN